MRRANERNGGVERRPAALRVFESLDRSGNGRVSRRDFRRALVELGFDRLGNEEAADILDHFDPNRCRAMAMKLSKYFVSRQAEALSTSIS